MFLHIGENISIYKKDIVAILDKKTIDTSKEKAFIDRINKNNISLSEDNIKTYIIALDKDNKDYSLYTSSISSITLLNRK